MTKDILISQAGSEEEEEDILLAELLAFPCIHLAHQLDGDLVQSRIDALVDLLNTFHHDEEGNLEQAKNRMLESFDWYARYLDTLE